VITRSYLWDDATINGMQINLAVKGVCHEARVGAVQRDAGFVATGFYSENVHVRRMIARIRASKPSSFEPKHFANQQIRRYHARLSPGHVPGLFMFGWNT
jgi:hypothetical protein